MSQQLSTSRRPVMLAAMFLIVAAAAFAGAFYALDGPRLVMPAYRVALDLIASVTPPGKADGRETPVATPAEATSAIEVPPGMPSEFALRLWQEQIDSQPLIERLIEGEVAALDINDVVIEGERAKLIVSVTFGDGTKVPGVIGLTRYSGSWYVGFVSAQREGVTPGPGDSRLPQVSDVDVPLLNTVIQQQAKSKGVLDEYVGGIVKGVEIGDINRGPSTVTLDLEMNETHGDAYAQLVVIRKELDGKPNWFLARFTKTGHNSPPEQ